MRIGVLGPVTVDDDPGFLGPRDRVVLAALALRTGEAVQAEELVDAMWAARPPATADKVVQGCIVRLRKRLGPAAIQTTPSGYRLALAPCDIDATRFEQLLTDARRAMAAGEPDVATRALCEGLGLWRGRPFLELDGWQPGSIEALRLEELRLDAEEDRLQAALDGGRHREVIADAQARAAAAPLRERRWVLLADAQHRAGRQGDALRTIHRARGIVREQGLDPGPELLALEAVVLQGRTPPRHGRRAGDRDRRAPAPVPDGRPPMLRLTAALPFSGRTVEHDALWEAWVRCRAGGFAVVLVAGEPGIGKTRLVAEVASRALGEGGTVLAGRCEEELRLPFAPFVGALRWLVDHSPSDVLVPRLGRHPGELVSLVPELDDVVPGLARSAAADGDTERYRLFEAVCSWLGSGGSGAPTVLVLDDVHVADTGTVLLLRHLVGVAPEGLLVLCTYRDTDIPRSHPLAAALADLRSAASVTRMVLGGLTEGGVRDLVERASGRPLDDAGVAFAAMVRRETSGNPLFVGEVLRHLTESGARAVCDGASGTDVDLAALGVPAGIAEVIGRRLSRLQVGTESVLRAAAVIGTEFDVGVLADVVERSEGEVLDLVEHAAAAALVIEVGVDRFRFAHALVRDTLHAELGASRRARAHRRVAQVIEQRHADDLDGVAALLALHWGEACAGGDTLVAVEWAQRAGEHDLARRAPDEAACWFARALELLGRHHDEARRRSLLSRLAHAQSRTNSPAAGDTADRAAALALDAGDVGAAAEELCRWVRKGYHGGQQPDEGKIALLDRTLALVGDGDPHLRGRLLAHLASELIFIGDHTRRERIVDELRHLIDVTDDPVRRWQLMAGGTVGPDRRWSDRTALEAVRRHCDEALPHLADDFDRVEVQELVWPVCAALGDRDGCDRALAALEEERSPAAQLSHDFFAATTASLDGRLDDYERTCAAIVRGLEAAHHPRVITFWWSTTFTRMREEGTLAALPALAQHWNDVHGQFPLSPSTDACDAMLQLLMGEPEHISLDTIDPDRMPDDGGRGSFVAFTAEVAAAVGDERLLRPMLRLVEPFHGMHLITRSTYWGPYDRLAALLRDRLGDHELADEAFARAVAACDALRTPVWLARTELDWADSLARRSRHDAATTRLVRARAAIGDLPLTDSLRRAGELAARLG